MVELLSFYKYVLVVFLDGAESSVAWLVFPPLRYVYPFYEH